MNAMKNNEFGKRSKVEINLHGYNADIDMARKSFEQGVFLEAFDIYEQLLAAYPDRGVALLSEVYDCYQRLPEKDRYNLYQARHFDFGIAPSDKVLDMGSGHIPFSLATHLADITLEDHQYGRAAIPFKHIKGKPVFECNIENMCFEDKEFDFIYCSHVLEHTENPEKACREIMRVAKRGYIETPTKGKDIFLNSGKISNHKLWVEVINGKLVFTRYLPEEIKGLQCSILLNMHVAPQTIREKAFSALIFLKPHLVNTMFLWDGDFEFEIRGGIRTRDDKKSEMRSNNPKITPDEKKTQFAKSHQREMMSRGLERQNNPQMIAPGKTDPNGNLVVRRDSIRFLQIHSFYQTYLDVFYKSNPHLCTASFDEQIKAILADGFSEIHIFPPYMGALNYDPMFIVANNPYAQFAWANENGVRPSHKDKNSLITLLNKQISQFKPDVLYIGDPTVFDSRFISLLDWKPKIVLGWRAANIPQQTDWSGFDVILSSLSNLRDAAIKLGAQATEHFFPGYPEWRNKDLHSVTPQFDVVFSGTWSINQHPQRNKYIKAIAEVASSGRNEISCAFYLNGQKNMIPAQVEKYNRGPRFGRSMYKALRSGKIVIDARGILEITNHSQQRLVDLAGNETANMRIFEATGCGSFLLTEHHENLKEYFEPEVEIETFRNTEELIEKIKYYLEHPEKREAIARKGQERCLNEYSMEVRAVEFDRIIKKYLKQKISASNSTLNSGIPGGNTPKEDTPWNREALFEEISELTDAAEQQIGQENFVGASLSLDQALKIDPERHWLNINFGNILLKMGKTEDAYIAFRNAICAEPANSLGYTSLGIAFLQGGLIKDAQIVLEKAVLLDENDQEALLLLEKIKTDHKEG